MDDYANVSTSWRVEPERAHRAASRARLEAGRVGHPLRQRHAAAGVAHGRALLPRAHRRLRHAHTNQGALTGRQADLFAQVSKAIKAFYDDMVALGVANKVLIMTFSEFGRRRRRERRRAQRRHRPRRGRAALRRRQPGDHRARRRPRLRPRACARCGPPRRRPEPRLAHGLQASVRDDHRPVAERQLGRGPRQCVHARSVRLDMTATSIAASSRSRRRRVSVHARGGGSPLTDCLAEFSGTPANRPASRPRDIRCIDNDPACDEDPTPGVCGFHVGVCLNVSDPDLPACGPGRSGGVRGRERAARHEPAPRLRLPRARGRAHVPDAARRRRSGRTSARRPSR